MVSLMMVLRSRKNFLRTYAVLITILFRSSMYLFHLIFSEEKVYQYLKLLIPSTLVFRISTIHTLITNHPITIIMVKNCMDYSKYFTLFSICRN
jgi:hypothetical protein